MDSLRRSVCMKFTYFETKKQRERERKLENNMLKQFEQEQLAKVKPTESLSRKGKIPDTPFSYSVKEGYYNEVHVEIFFTGTFPKIVSRYYKISRLTHAVERYYPAGIPTPIHSYEYKWKEEAPKRVGEMAPSYCYERVDSFVRRYRSELVKSIE